MSRPRTEEDAPGFKQCKDWRRELQRGFLSKSQPKADVRLLVIWLCPAIQICCAGNARL
jgi:hypothetical protein